jgi:glycosyltransferase involved in cell wall biosynthesis
LNNHLSVAVVVLTFNEESNLAECLKSVAGWAKETFVVDSGSTDRTREISTRHAARVFEHPFETHAKQWGWALRNLPLDSDWILSLDADQRVTPELAAEIQSLTASDLEGVDGVFLKRRQVFRNKWIRHGGYYPKYLLKLFRRGSVHTDPSDLVDHHFYVAGKTIQLRHDLVEANKKEDDIAFWIEKHNRYARLLAIEQFQRAAAGHYAVTPSFFGNPDERSVFLKKIWVRLPLYVRPFLYFIYRYVIRLGFLDGKEGAIFHFLQAFWFRLLVDINVDQLRRDGAGA